MAKEKSLTFNYISNIAKIFVKSSFKKSLHFQIILSAVWKTYEICF